MAWRGLWGRGRGDGESKQLADATIRDVARRAGVSVASVSRTLNAPASVQEATRARILTAIAELGYVPHAGARSLSTRLSHAIGVVLPDLHGEFFSELVRGMDRAASAHGYQLFLSTMHADAALAAQAIRAMRGRVDGLIVMAPQLGPADLAVMVSGSLPTVVVNSIDGGGRHILRIDNRHGVDALIDHFAGLGRRRIVHIGGPAGNIDAIERADAYRAAMARIAPDWSPIIIDGDFSEEAGAAAVAQLARDEIAFDALFAANDMMALGALNALRAAGRKVPEDVVVAGFDDIPLARYLGLTTLTVRMDELGERAVMRLIGELKGPPPPPAIELVKPLLAIRSTSGAE